MAKTSTERQHRNSERYYDRLAQGLTLELEIGDRVELQKTGRAGLVIATREREHGKEYQVEIFEGGTTRWVSRGDAVFMPPKRRLYKRAGRIHELWSNRDERDRSEWAQSPPVEIRVFGGTEVLTAVEL